MEIHNTKSELSLEERDRRWSLVRESMRKEGLAAIIVLGDPLHWISFRYLTNVYPTGQSQLAMLFPAEGNPVLISSQPRNAYFAKNNPWWLSAEDIYQSYNLAAELAKHVIALKGQNKRVGIDSYRTWPVREYRIFIGLCPDVDLIEVRELLARLRGPKSREELKLMEEAIRIGELAQRTLLANLKPGKKEEEVIGKVEDVVRSNGVDLRLWLMSSNPENPYPDIPGKASIIRPNPITFSSEFVRTMGYACQVIRTYCWEEPKGEYKRMWELVKELRSTAVKEFRPGREITEAAAKVEALINMAGFTCDYMGHAVGIDMSDLPYISSGPTKQNYIPWTIMPNEVYCLHPMIRGKGGKPAFLWVGDMYLVMEDSTKWMTSSLAGVPEIIPE